VGHGVHGDLALCHHLQQRGLRLRRAAVDLVGDDDVGEDRARVELELLAALVVDRHPGHVAGQQVGRELDAPPGRADAVGQAAGERRLAQPGHVLDEQVPLGEQGDHGQRIASGLPCTTRSTFAATSSYACPGALSDPSPQFSRCQDWHRLPENEVA
jgi:hypothetical protein